MKKQILTNSEKETFDFGFKFGQKLKRGEIIALQGNLGAGKTVLAKGIAKGLGIKKIVNSPTFNIMKIYKIPKHPILKLLIHIDAYRLKNYKDLINIGSQEYFNRSDSVVIIEWAEKIKKILPKNAKKIKIKTTNIKNNSYEKIFFIS